MSELQTENLTPKEHSLSDALSGDVDGFCDFAAQREKENRDFEQSYTVLLNRVAFAKGEEREKLLAML